jgi:transcriptional regulator with XRE-family HTH domain
VARRVSGLSQAELARRGGTSQATISAYERGLKTPSLNVAARLLDVMGCELMLHVRIDFEQYHPEGIVPFWAPNLLWRVPTPDCFDTLRIPDLLQQTSQTEWNLADRTDRRRAYEILIRRGLPQQMIRWLDGALLVDLWEALDLPDPVRKVWLPAIAAARDGRIGVDTLNWGRQDPDAAAYAGVRGYEPLPSPPPPPPPRRSPLRPET